MISTKLEELDEQAQFVLFKKVTSAYLLYITREKMSDYDLKINITESWDSFSKSCGSKARESRFSKFMRRQREKRANYVQR